MSLFKLRSRRTSPPVPTPFDHGDTVAQSALGSPSALPPSPPSHQSQTATMPLIYGPETGPEWLAAVSSLTEVTAYKQLSYDLLTLRPGQTVLDLGCGIGDDVRAIAAAVAPDGSVTGADADASMIEQARVRQEDLVAPAAAAVHFVVADAEQLDFPDKTFDAVRVDRMLQHTATPASAIREIYRVLRPGGRVVIIEPDWKSMAVYPGSAAGGDDDSAAAAIFQWHVTQIRHPLIGRQLRHFLVEAGFREIQAFPMAYASYHFPVADLVLELTASAAAAVNTKPPLLSQDAATSWIEAMRAADTNGEFFVSVPLMFGCGIRGDNSQL